MMNSTVIWLQGRQCTVSSTERWLITHASSKSIKHWFICGYLSEQEVCDEWLGRTGNVIRQVETKWFCQLPRPLATSRSYVQTRQSPTLSPGWHHRQQQGDKSQRTSTSKRERERIDTQRQNKVNYLRGRFWGSDFFNYNNMVDEQYTEAICENVLL